MGFLASSLIFELGPMILFFILIFGPSSKLRNYIIFLSTDVNQCRDTSICNLVMVEFWIPTIKDIWCLWISEWEIKSAIKDPKLGWFLPSRASSPDSQKHPIYTYMHVTGWHGFINYVAHIYVLYNYVHNTWSNNN